MHGHQKHAILRQTNGRDNAYLKGDTKMAVSALTAAKHLCEASGWRLSNLELQKILYNAHMVRLGQTGGTQPLVNEEFEAWDYGPVIPELYRHVKTFGSKPVGNVFHGVPSMPPGEDQAVLNSALQTFGRKRPGELVAITHWEEGAWAKHYRPGGFGSTIPNEDVVEEYRRRFNGKPQALG